MDRQDLHNSIIIVIKILLLLFISHITSCIGGHISIGHQAISYSLRYLGSFLRSLLKIFADPIIIIIIIIIIVIIIIIILFFCILQALFGVQFVLSVVMATMLQKFSPYISLARWILCNEQ